MLSKNAFQRLVKQCLAEVIVEAPVGAGKHIVQYAVLGLEQIPPSTHNSKGESLQAAKTFIQSYNTRGSKTAGEFVEKIQDGWCLKHVGGGTVAIAKVSPVGQTTEESQPEPYDAETDTFAPGPRDRTEPVPKNQPKPNTNEAAQQLNKVSQSEKGKIGKAFAQSGLDGNGRFEKKEHGLAAVSNALSTLGFQLDMVSGDMIMGDKGSRNFIYRRVNSPGQDTFTEQPEISNSRIAFTWENLSGQGQSAKFEVLAYAS